MNRRIVKSDRAVLDLVEVSDYLAERSPNAALRFLQAADEDFSRLCALPGIGTPYEVNGRPTGNLRYLPLSRFRQYIVFYRDVAYGIEVVRVIHGSRNIHAILADEFGP